MTDDASIDVLGGNAQTQLRAIIERAERLNEDKAAVMADLKEVFAEAKGNGFDVKALKAIVARRRQDQEKLALHEALVDTYATALGG